MRREVLKSQHKSNGGLPMPKVSAARKAYNAYSKDFTRATDAAFENIKWVDIKSIKDTQNQTVALRINSSYTLVMVVAILETSKQVFVWQVLTYIVSSVSGTIFPVSRYPRRFKGIVKMMREGILLDCGDGRISSTESSNMYITIKPLSSDDLAVVTAAQNERELKSEPESHE